jgi:hypothetical protein
MKKILVVMVAFLTSSAASSQTSAPAPIPPTKNSPVSDYDLIKAARAKADADEKKDQRRARGTGVPMVSVRLNGISIPRPMAYFDLGVAGLLRSAIAASKLTYSWSAN